MREYEITVNGSTMSFLVAPGDKPPKGATEVKPRKKPSPKKKAEGAATGAKEKTPANKAKTPKNKAGSPDDKKGDEGAGTAGE